MGDVLKVKYIDKQLYLTYHLYRHHHVVLNFKKLTITLLTTSLHIINMSSGKSGNNAYVLGVGMTKFIKPRGLREYPEMGYEAGVKAMLDAQINYDDVQHGVACFAYGDSTSGQRIFYQFGMTTIPIVNTSNACATGSVGLYLARSLVRSGTADCVLVVGVEKMKPGSLKSVWDDRPSSSGIFAARMREQRGLDPKSPLTAQYFGNAGREYMEK